MHRTSRNRPGHFRHTRRNAAVQLRAQNEPESPRPLPPHSPEHGGATPCTERAGIAPVTSATLAGTRQSNGLANLNGIAPATSATLAATRRTNSMYKTSRNRPGLFRHTRRNAADQLHAQNKPESPRPLPPHTPERGGPTPCTKRAGIAPPTSATHAGTRRIGSMHRTSRNRPAHFRRTRWNAAEQLHAQNEPESPRPLPPQTPERGGPTPCTKRAGIAPAPSATLAGARRTNSMHRTSRNREL